MDAISQAIFERTYSRKKPNGQNETWEETVDRVVRGNTRMDNTCTDYKREELRKSLLGMDILPGGRHLWATGAEGKEFISNCYATGWSQGWIEHYRFMFLRLMEGGGVGSNYSNALMRLPPKLSAPIVHAVCHHMHPDYKQIAGVENIGNLPNCGIVRVGDSRSGWAYALEQLLLAAESSNPIHIAFDYGTVRPRGSDIAGSGGKASGPAALHQIFLDIATAIRENKPDSIMAMLISHAIAKGVMAGNSRRSAQIAVKDWRDSDAMDFINFKRNHPEVYTINLSLATDQRFYLAQDMVKAVAEGMYTVGDPGICTWPTVCDGETQPIFSPNPCGELYLPEFGSCCLASVNLNTEREDIENLFRIATRFLIRATMFKAQDSKTQSVIDLQRRIGVGFTGLADFMAKRGIAYDNTRALRPYLNKWRNAVAIAADVYCDKLGISHPIKVTCVPPCGTMSKLAGCSEGMQPHLYDYFIRRVIFDNDNDTLARLREEGYYIEKSTCAAHSSVVEFPCKAKILDTVESIVTAEDLSIEQQLELQAEVQATYADNSISYTVNFNPDKYSVDDIARAIHDYGPRLKGTTMLPTCNGQFSQMPYERITKAEYERMAEAVGHRADTAHADCKGGSCQARPFSD
jgi:ribonucleoside-triphosphate reductase